MICSKCGRVAAGYIIEVRNGQSFIWCQQCYSFLNTCNACKKAQRCSFSEDKNSPDYVMRQFQQGPQFIQMQVKNPDKEDIYCTKCECWNKEEKYCMREWGLCLNYEEVK